MAFRTALVRTPRHSSTLLVALRLPMSEVRPEVRKIPQCGVFHSIGVLRGREGDFSSWRDTPIRRSIARS